MLLTPLSARDRNRQNKEAWDRLYGRTDRLVWGERPLGFVEELVPLALPDRPGPLRVLDAGTGEGRNLPVLLAAGAEVHACDASANAMRKIPPGLRARVRLAECDLASLPFPAAHFDFVLSTDVVETLPEPDRVLREMARVLRPGGRLLCNIPGMEDGVAGEEMTELGADCFLYRERFFYRFMTEEDATLLLERHGLRVRAVRRYTWTEGTHPGFRQEEHSHTSRVFLAERAP